MQTECFWPSGTAIRHMNSARRLELLSSLGVEPDLEMSMGDLRQLVHRLKRSSHENGDCDCPAADYIRRGGGQARVLPPGYTACAKSGLGGCDEL